METLCRRKDLKRSGMICRMRLRTTRQRSLNLAPASCILLVTRKLSVDCSLLCARMLTGRASCTCGVGMQRLTKAISTPVREKQFVLILSLLHLLIGTNGMGRKSLKKSRRFSQYTSRPTTQIYNMRICPTPIRFLCTMQARRTGQISRKPWLALINAILFRESVVLSRLHPTGIRSRRSLWS